MALSSKERENIRKKGEIIDSLSNKVEENTVYPLNEGTDDRFRDLSRLEDYIKGKKFFALKKNSFSDGAIVAFMDGAQGPMGQAWNVGPCCTDADDVQFT